MANLDQYKRAIARYYVPFSWSTSDKIYFSDTNLVAGKIKRIASHLSPDETKEILDFVRSLEDTIYKKYNKHIFTERHSVWKLADYSAEVEKKNEERASREDKTIELSQCTVELSYTDDRIKVLFDSIPTASVRSELKHAGFRWSPSNSAWQRQLTDNAIWAVTQRTYRALSFLTDEDKKAIADAYKGKSEASQNDNESKRKRALALMLKMKMAKAKI